VTVGQAVAEQERILIVDEGSEDLLAEQEILKHNFPHSHISIANSLDQYRERLENSSFDLVILDDSLPGANPLELMRELLSSDHEPGVLVVAASTDPQAVSDLYAAGCQKCIVKKGDWLHELSPAARHIFRTRRLEEENLKLLSKLTEANILLEQKNRRLDEFTSTLAHDIRGPLGGISMKLDYIIDTYKPELPSRVALLLERAMSSVGRLTSIVQSMYEYARLGREAAATGLVDLHTLVADVVSDLNFEEAFHVKVGLGDLPTVWGSADQLRRVFSNLLSNAVKYNDKPEVRINVGLSKLYQNGLGPYAEIFIHDNGPGIAPADRQRIFSMFNRGHGDAPSDGLGVGLAVVQRIVELHFGKVWIDPENEVGCRVVIALPLERVDFVEMLPG